MSHLFITSVVNHVGGVNATASVGAAGRFCSFAFMPIMAMSQSISIISAQSFGAGFPDRAAHTCRIGAILSVVFSYSFFAFIRTYPDTVVMIFSSDPAVIAAGIPYIRSFSFEFLIIPLLFCMNGMLMGGGHTTFTMINNVLSSVLLRVPMSYLLGLYFDLGLRGIGLAAPIGSGCVLIAVTIYVASGRWKVNKISEVGSMPVSYSFD